MDLPVTDAEPLVDEAGFEYRLNAAGEREYYLPEPGEDPEYDGWFRAEIEQALCEADDPNTVWIDHEEIERETEARIAEWEQRSGAGPTRP